MIESGVSGSVEDLVAWDKCNPKLAGSTSFGRLMPCTLQSS